jgi:hypothetical protein
MNNQHILHASCITPRRYCVRQVRLENQTWGIDEGLICLAFDMVTRIKEMDSILKNFSLRFHAPQF